MLYSMISFGFRPIGLAFVFYGLRVREGAAYGLNLHANTAMMILSILKML